MSVIRVAYLLEQCWHRVPGGTGIASKELAKTLNLMEGIEIKGVTAAHIQNPKIELPDGLSIYRHRVPRQVLYRAWNNLNWPTPDRLVGDCDLVHASGGAIPPTKFPLVSTIYDLSWRHNSEWFPKRGRDFAEECLKNSAKAERIICPSETTRFDLLEAGFDPEKLKVIPLGVEEKKVSLEEVKLLRKSNKLETPFVLWMGTIEPRKNLPTLVDAMSKIPHIPLVLVGPVGWNVDVEKIIKPIRDRVKLVGRVDEAVKHVWLKAADVFCFPSLLEGFGLPVIEAMSQGTPVVTSGTTATAEVAGNSGVLIDPQNSSEIFEAVSMILENKDFSEELSKKSIERSKDFSWRKSAEKTKKVYGEVLSD